MQPMTTMNGSGSASNGDTNQCIVDIEENLIPSSECCIYKVPKRLRKINEEAYTPQVISIGPFHHCNEELADMQKQKIRYQSDLVKRIGREKFDQKLKRFVEDEEKTIRKCFAEASKLSSPDFIKMILYDAVFILELFWRNHHKEKGEFLLTKTWLTNAIRLDLQLLENQLPYFVLEKFYMSAYGSDNGEEFPSLLDLSCQFFGYDVPAQVPNEGDLKHFVDMRRYAMVLEFHLHPKPKGTIEDLPSAVTLNESGVMFKTVPICKSSNGLLDLKFKKGTRCIPFFCKNELQIPRITIEDCTECLIRNLMAFEQCHYPSDTHICNYIDLIDSLIDTCKDVDLLVENGIISNRVGDHASIAEMFNKLCLQIATSDSYYSDIINDLKSHHRGWWNRTKATLVSVYFRDVWRGTATTAATIILLLAVLQTVQRLWGGWVPRSK